MMDDLTRNVLEQRDNIENQRNRELNSNREEYIKQLQQENRQLKDILSERELWLRACILELMKIAEKDYYWIMNHQIENAKSTIIDYGVAGNGDIQFSKTQEDNKEE